MLHWTFLLKCIFIISITSQAANSPRIHNYSSSFVEFWNKVQTLPLDEQITEFDRSIYPTFPDFYDYKYKNWTAAGKTKEEQFKKQFDNFASIHKKYEEKTKSLTKDIKRNLQTFVKSFPDFNKDFDIYIIHSLGEMDGGTRIIAGKFYFIFGIDGIVNFHNSSTDTPFFHHELFHVYHRQFFKDEEKIWTALWAEGLATYVSEALNPGSSLRDIMLDIPTGLVEACEKDMHYLWSDVLSVLDSTDEKTYEKYFLLSSKDQRVPKRSGYYLGYQIAKILAQSFSLRDLIMMENAQLRELIENTIAKQIE